MKLLKDSRPEGKEGGWCWQGKEGGWCWQGKEGGWGRKARRVGGFSRECALLWYSHTQAWSWLIVIIRLAAVGSRVGSSRPTHEWPRKNEYDDDEIETFHILESEQNISEYKMMDLPPSLYYTIPSILRSFCFLLRCSNNSKMTDTIHRACLSARSRFRRGLTPTYRYDAWRNISIRRL